ncbi:mannose-6-phosphate receptor binding protein 1 [Brienomyrus brachyistius]|uniref:mannose-6-phosphate receptor binding protein 1 n=1 Tax=Brienomyrus brachyistius TaxID=42636 RepID=UPI0020B353EB|nr:mannose-6-phosphate receptor binding protein 1 [Brienomyrus brachyistius]
MADFASSSDEVIAATGKPSAVEQQSVVSRAGSLPLVSSTCEAVLGAYSTTKDNVPLLRGVANVAESGVRTLGAAVATGSKPLLDMLESEIAVVNSYAMKGLDKVEQSFPILQQPADKLVSDTVGMVCQSVSGAKEAMTGAVKAAVTGGVDLTRAAVSGGISTVLGSRVGQMVSSGVGLAISHSEDWVEQNLPISEKELAALAEPPPAEEAQALENCSSSSPSYFVRLGMLSSKVRDRALEQSVGRARRARDTTHTALSQIASTLDLLEGSRSALASAGSQLVGAREQLLQRWAEWQEGRGVTESAKEQGELESRVLSMVRGLSVQVRTACAGVVSSAQGLPSAVQEQLSSARRAADELHSSLRDTSVLSPPLLEQSRQQLTQIRKSLDGVVEYFLHNTPLNWLVGPFAPLIAEKAEEVQQGED